MASFDPSAAREFLDDAEIPASDRTEFVDGLRAFLTGDSTTLEIPADAAKLKVWGEALNQVASYLFASARALSPKPAKKSPTKVYQLTASEVELWQEIQNARSKSQSLEADGLQLPAMPSSEQFVVDHITDEELGEK
jgi:hypothetical protein